MSSIPNLIRSAVCRAAILLSIGIGGCGVTESVTLQDVNVTGPTAGPPLFITQNATPSQFIVSPHLILPTSNTVTGSIDLEETRTYRQAVHDTNNFSWRIPKTAAGVNINFTMSHHAAIAFGMSLSRLGGRTYGGWSAGIGLFNEKENQAIRFDFGLQSTPILYSALTQVIVKTGSRTDTSLYLDDGEESHVNLYGALTLNTTRKTWPVNVFLHAFVTKQRFIDYVPQSGIGPFYFANDTRASASQWIVGLTPGLFVDLMDDVRLVMGERIIFPFDIVNQDPYPLLQFHMQLDLTI